MRRRLPDVEAEERALVDVERQVGRRGPGTALGDHVDRRRRCSPGRSRRARSPARGTAAGGAASAPGRSPARPRRRPGAASSWSRGMRLQAREQQQHHERRPLPDQRGHHRRQRVGRPTQSTWPTPNSDSTPVDHAVGRVEQRRLPHQRARDGRDEERRDQQRPDDAAADERAGRAAARCSRPSSTRDQHDAERSVIDRVAATTDAELRVREHRDVVAQPDELPRPGPHAGSRTAASSTASAGTGSASRRS